MAMNNGRLTSDRFPYLPVRDALSLGPLGPFSALVITLGDEPLVGAGVARHVTIILDHGRRVIVEP